MAEAYLIVTVELGGNIINFETGEGSSTKKHLYAYKTLASARRQLAIMRRLREGYFGVTEYSLAIAGIKNNKVEIIYG